MKTRESRIRNERGATLILVGASLILLFGVTALAIDVGMIMDARAEARRAAEAGALAGASIFQSPPATGIVAAATGRAKEYAGYNTLRQTPVDSASEVFVTVLTDSNRVRVRVQRDSVPTFFARVLGFNAVRIQGTAAAEVFISNTGPCVKPLALPDMWEEMGEDGDGDRIWDSTEVWMFNSGVDRYEKFDPSSASNTQTGYGSGWRNNRDAYTDDQGRPVKIKMADPGQTGNPSVFYPFRFVGNNGASDYARDLAGCRDLDLTLTYDIEPGNMTGPTFDAIADVLCRDLSATYDPSTNTVDNVDPQYGDWRNSPRVFHLPLYHPGQITGSGMTSIQFNDMGVLFLENPFQNGNASLNCNSNGKKWTGRQPDFIVGRFLYYAQGGAPTGTPTGGTGALTRVLRLVE